MHDTTVILIEVGALLLGMSLLGRFAARIGFSPIPLYLIAGLAFGTGGVIPLDASSDFFEIGSEIGVILLLALLGLEYSADQLLSGLRRSRIAGLLDGLLNAVPGAAFGLIMGWGPVAAVAVAGICWVTSSGVAAKLLRDLGRIGNRETPVILSILVIEDLAMAFYLPTLSALVIGVSIAQGAIRVAVAVGVVVIILFVALRFGHIVSRLFTPDHAEPLLLGSGSHDVGRGARRGGQRVVRGGRVPRRHRPVRPCRPLRSRGAHAAARPVRGVLLRLLRARHRREQTPECAPARRDPGRGDDGDEDLTGYFAAKRAGIGIPGRWRAGIGLTPRGEFSIVIAGLAAGTAPALAPLAAVYVFITIIGGTLLARVPDLQWFKRVTARRPAAIAR